MTKPEIGISGLASYFPPYRVSLSDWCRWTGDSWSKVASVVGHSYRMPGARQNAYTMAATALMRLIDQYGVDPSRIGFLGLGTESSTDNSAGAIIVKGMVNAALATQGRPTIARNCEVPEFKHACLGGVYAMKAAARYLAVDGAGRVAIVLCSDIAEYERGTSGEVTQGAGAVAMLMEADPKMLVVELELSGTASDYRGPDFRKPFSRFAAQQPQANGQLRDFPLFNGKYSTTCYLDEVLAATEDLASRLEGSARQFLSEMAAVFLHRPNQRMAETGLTIMLLYLMAVDGPDARHELEEYARAAEVDLSELVRELTERRRVYDLVEQGRVSDELYPLSMATVRALRGTSAWHSLVARPLSLGATEMNQVGNLYTASLPAWIAAGFEDALTRGVQLDNQRILTVGYGSGDAADIIAMRVVPEWRKAAGTICFARALADAIDINEHEYATLHDRSENLVHAAEQPETFVIDKIGTRTAQYDDMGMEYYRYVNA